MLEHIVLDKAAGGEVTAWHVEDRKGNRSTNLGGPGVENIDLVLGQGRVAGQAILKDVGRAMLARSYASAEHAGAPAAAQAGLSVIPASWAVAGIVLLVGVAGVGYEIGRRRAGSGR